MSRVERLVEEPQLVRVALVVRAVGERAALFAVELRVDVDAAHQQEARGVLG